jgi:acid phosphatase
MTRWIAAFRTTGLPFGFRVIIVATAVLYASCATGSARADDAAGCPTSTAKQAVDTQWPINIGILAQQLIVYRCADYLKDFAAVTDKARAFIAQRAPQVEQPAVVFDIDETSLSNWKAIYHNQFGYVATGACDLGDANELCGQHAWELSARGVALAPTLDLFRFLKTLKGKNGEKVAAFFITGRFESPAERRATVRNLRKAGYEGWTGLILRPQSTKKEDVAQFKSGAREQIEQKKEHYTIIANLGDQYSDLDGNAAGEHAESCFKLPNPFYFIPPDLPAAGLKCLAR